MATWLLVLRGLHQHMAYTGLYAGVLLAGLAFWVALVQRRDVTRLFRATAYIVAGTFVAQGVLGALLWQAGLRPGAEVHWIYGLGAALALPFFIFIEQTAQKRPSMGSYVWGFGMLTAIALRSILTG